MSKNNGSIKQDQKNRIAALSDWNPNPIVELDEKLTITYANMAARLKFPELLSPELQISHPLILALAANVPVLLESKSEVVVFEQELMLDSIIYDAQIFAIPKNKRVYVFLNDTTKRKEAEDERRIMQEKLFRSQKLEAIGQMAGGIAHDFNNILTVIQGNLQLVKVDVPQNSKEMKRITAALEATMRAGQLSKRLLDFARHDHVQPKIIDLSEHLTDIIDLIKPSLGKDIEIEVDIENNLEKIYVDPIQLDNAILNLAVNAKDAMENKGKIMIVGRNTILETKDIAQNSDVQPGKYVKLSIMDNGTGIPNNILNQLGRPFFTTKERGKGTGLGLSQVRAFMQEARGFLNIESEEGKGSSFHLCFPKASTLTQD